MCVFVKASYLGMLSALMMVEEPSNFFSFLGLRVCGKRCRATSSSCSCSGVLKADSRSVCRAPMRTSSNTSSGTWWTGWHTLESENPWKYLKNTIFIAVTRLQLSPQRGCPSWSWWVGPSGVVCADWGSAGAAHIPTPPVAPAQKQDRELRDHNVFDRASAVLDLLCHLDLKSLVKFTTVQRPESDATMISFFFPAFPMIGIP